MWQGNASFMRGRTSETMCTHRLFASLTMRLRHTHYTHHIKKNHLALMLHKFSQAYYDFRELDYSHIRFDSIWGFLEKWFLAYCQLNPNQMIIWRCKRGRKRQRRRGVGGDPFRAQKEKKNIRTTRVQFHLYNIHLFCLNKNGFDLNMNEKNAYFINGKSRNLIFFIKL